MALLTAMPPNPAPTADHGDRRPGRAVPARALPSGTRLRDYELQSVLAEGACSIVYAAWDHSLQRKVAVKEYMPASLAARAVGGPGVVVSAERHLDPFKAGLKSFVNEARLLARFDHPSLAKVYRFWEENASAYMVMPFYEGPTLLAALASLGHVPSEGELRTWLRPVLDAVAVLHHGRVWHEGIGPDAILLTPTGPVLLGFAAADRAIAGLERTPSAALTPGFAAIEQYSDAAAAPRGPWTDLYALAAVIYFAIAGEEPQPAPERADEDRVRPLAMVAAGLYSKSFLSTIDAAMAVQPERRPQDHLAFRALMGDIEAPERLELAPPRDLMQEPFIGGIAAEREITVPDRPIAPTVPPAETRPTPVEPPRAKTSPARPAPAAPPPARRVPSWLSGERRGPGFGNRALYGVVAVTFALIGLAALGLQFYTRQSARATPASSPASAPVVAGGEASGGATAPPPSAVLTTAPRPPSLPAPTPVPAAAPVAAVATSPAAAPPATRAAPSVSGSLTLPTGASAASMSAAERQARCLDILQKASLEPITAAETAFFKKECR